MELTVKCYYDTGLLIGNSPESITTLDSMGFTTKTFPAIWTLQDKVLPYIKIASDYSTISSADYCVIGSAAYWITNISMLNENVAVLALALDAIGTIGIDNIQVISGWCTRKCVTDDTIFSNTFSEPFSPTEPLVLDKGTQIGDRISDRNYDFVVTTANVLSESKVADEYVSEQEGVTGLSVVVPRTPPYKGNSTFIMTLPQGVTKTFNLPLYGTFSLDSSAVRDGIDKCRSLGIENTIYKSYSVPTFYASAEISGDGAVVSVTATIHTSGITQTPFKYRTVKNNKAVANSYNKYTLTSITSGDSAEYLAKDIYNNADFPEFVLFSDPSPFGNPFCRPKYYHGDTTNMFMGVVQGSDWLESPLSFNIQSGVAIKYNQRTRAMKRELYPLVAEGISYAGTFINALAQSGLTNALAATGGKVASNVATSKSTALSTQRYNGYMVYNKGYTAGGMVREGALATYEQRDDIVDWAQRSITAMYNQAEDFKRFEEYANITEPEVRFPINSSLQSYLNNGFWVYRTRLSDTDTERFDDFLSAYGYTVSEKLTTDAFNGRVNHNYVKANNPVFKAVGYPQYIISTAAEAVSTGVRIWHTAPSQERLYNNPIKGA